MNKQTTTKLSKGKVTVKQVKGPICIKFPKGHSAILDMDTGTLYIKFFRGLVGRTEEFREGILIDYNYGVSVTGLSFIYPKRVTKKMMERLAKHIKEPEVAFISPKVIAKCFLRG